MKTKFFYGMTALATLGLAACTADELAPSAPGQVAEADMTRYISVQITSPSAGGTRAEGDVTPPEGYGDNNPTFGEGIAAESKVDKVYFVFYDADNNVVGDIVNIDSSQLTFNDDKNSSNNSVASEVVGVNIQKGEKIPSGVLVYINPVTPEGMLNPLNVIETLKRTQVVTGEIKTGADGTTVDNRRFPMSNSVYFDQTTGNLCNITKIPTDGLFDTKAEAEKQLGISQGKPYQDKDGNNVTPTPDEITAASAKVTDIYVERYAAKVGFQWKPTVDGTEGGTANNNPEYKGAKVVTYTNQEGTETTTVEYTDVTLTFVPSKWDVNAESNDMFILKTYKNSTALGGLDLTNLTMATAQAKLGTNTAANWIWNQTNNHRSFWGCSPSYYSTTYPEVASDYVMNDGTANPNMLLKYLKWNEVTNDLGENNTWTTEYVRETTVGDLGLHKTPNHYASIPAVIVTGNYQLKGSDAAGVEWTLPAQTTFYLYSTGDNTNKGVFFEAAKVNDKQTLNSAAQVDGKAFGTSLLYRLANRQQTLWMHEVTTEAAGDGTTKTIKDVHRPLTEAEMAQFLTIAHPTQDVLNIGQTGADADVKLAARRYTIQLTNNLSISKKVEGNQTTTYTLQYNNGTGGYQNVPTTGATATPEEIVQLNTVNQLLARNVGYADKYEKGMAYFNIPVKHYGWYRPSNPNRTLSNGQFKDNASVDWAQTQVGDFGIVRNHHYQIRVTKVDGLATAISDTTTPIIPAQETEEHFIAYRLYILNWAILPVQNAEL